MSFLGRARNWFIGALITLVFSGMFRFVAVIGDKGFRDPCKQCLGAGKRLYPSPSGPVTSPCISCEGRGYFWTLDIRILKAGPSFVGDLALVFLLAFIGGLIYAFKVVDCRSCDTEGCDLCGGKGWLTAADRWALPG
jgi:hypothetical protein